MKIDDFVPVITAIISLIGSFVIAKTTTKRELNKIKLEQQHQIKLNTISAYALLREKLNTYIIQRIGKHHREAVAAVGNFLACCPESMEPICKELENLLLTEAVISDELLKRLDYQWNLAQTSNETDKR